MASSLLKTKLFIPPAHPTLVPRPRLVEAIESGVRNGHRVTLAAAPAGFGKTTAVSNWASQSQRLVAWLSLDDGDNEERLFWAYVIAAIQSVVPEFADHLLSSLTAAKSDPVQNLLAEIINELAVLAEPVTLVLDDYHVIHNSIIHENLSFMLEHQPQRFHIVIATRADPPITLARFRALRLLTELRVDDLRFSLQEAGFLLNEVMGLGLSAADVALLEARTEGWGVGLLLAAQSMQGRADKHAFITAFSGSQHFILEYLIEEVLDQQPQETRSFLLQTSILDRLSGSLCDAVLAARDSGKRLRWLGKENLFLIPLDQQHIWYRYHHLFAELLLNTLYKEFPEAEILALYQRASRWYQTAGDLDQSVKYALSGKDFEHAADLLETLIEKMIASGQVKTLLGLLGKLPDEVIQSRPRLLMHQGWVVFLSGKVRQSAQILLSAKRALNLTPEGEDRDLLYGRLSAMLATITSLTRDLPGAIAEAREALAVLPESARVFQARARRVLGVCAAFQGDMEQALDQLEQAKSAAIQGDNKFLASEILSQIATVRKHQGKLSMAWQAYQQILDMYEHPDQSPSACLGYIGMAEIALERYDFQEAQDYLETGIELCQKGSIGYALQPAFLIGGLLKQAFGDEQAAMETIQKGAALSREGGGSLESILGLAGFQTCLYLQLGEFDKARGWAVGEFLPGDWSFEDLPPVLEEIHQSLLARVYLKTRELEKVLDICDQILPQAKAGGRQARIMELSLFKAVALQELNRKTEALAMMEQCLSLAAPEGYLRLFVETGRTVIPLLQQMKETSTSRVHATKILSAFEKKEAGEPAQSVLIEPLTARELGVLRLMCAGFSNQQIADELIVSVNTVKKHTSNIYGKLGVKNRAQAVLRAREIQMI